MSDTRQMGREACFREWSEHARLLVEMGVDLIQAEYVGFIEDCLTAVVACTGAGATVLLGIRHIRPDGTMQYGERLKDLVEALEGRPLGAVLLMCSNPEAISAGLPRLRRAFSGPVGAYPNLGYNPTGPIVNGPMLTNQKPSSGPDILQNAEYTPSRLSVRQLREKGTVTFSALSPWPTDSLEQAGAAEEIEKHLWISIERDSETRTLSSVYGSVAAALVERYSPNAPQVVKNMAVIQISKYFNNHRPVVSSERVKIGDASQDVDTMPGMVSTLRNSGSMALISPWKRRRLGMVS